VESFNGRLRDECLNENRFDDLAEPPHSVELALKLRLDPITSSVSSQRIQQTIEKLVRVGIRQTLSVKQSWRRVVTQGHCRCRFFRDLDFSALQENKLICPIILCGHPERGPREDRVISSR
jgi:hypothetical protein